MNALPKLPRRRMGGMSPYDHSKMVMQAFLDVRKQLSPNATLEDAAKLLGVHSSSFHLARLHVEAVDMMEANPWMPRDQVLTEYRKTRPAVTNGTAQLIEGAIRALYQSATALPRFDVSVVSGYLNAQTAKRRYSVKKALRQLIPWLTQLDNELR